MKYRIIEHRFSSGEVRFEPQSRFLFWWSGWTEAVNEFQYAPLTFETIYEAEKFIAKQSSNPGYTQIVHAV